MRVPTDPAAEFSVTLKRLPNVWPRSRPTPVPRPGRPRARRPHRPPHPDRIGDSNGPDLRRLLLRAGLRRGARDSARTGRHLWPGGGGAGGEPRCACGGLALRVSIPEARARALAPRGRGGRPHFPARGGRAPRSSAAVEEGRRRLSATARSTCAATASTHERRFRRLGLARGRELPRRLRPLVRAKRTGPLRVTRGKLLKTVYLSRGASSSRPRRSRRSPGRDALRKGLITYRALEESCAPSARANARARCSWRTAPSAPRTSSKA
jgi:hypothetical protein